MEMAEAHQSCTAPAAPLHMAVVLHMVAEAVVGLAPLRMALAVGASMRT